MHVPSPTAARCGARQCHAMRSERSERSRTLVLRSYWDLGRDANLRTSDGLSLRRGACDRTQGLLTGPVNESSGGFAILPRNPPGLTKSDIPGST